jgi:hypothetical protein
LLDSPENLSGAGKVILSAERVSREIRGVRSAAAASQKKPSGTPSAEAPSASGSPAPQAAPVNPLWSLLAIPGTSRIQAKLTVGAPDDPFEREADRVADQVLRAPEPQVQRTCAACASGAPCTECAEEKKLRRKPAAPDSSAASATAGSIEPPQLGAGRPLEPAVRAFFEPRLGADLGPVRVHTSGPAAAAAKGLHALAFTVGNDIAFGSGMYRPQSPEGSRLLAHELVHVMQQTPAVIRRDTPQAEMQQTQEASVRGAIQFLDTLCGIVATDRRTARAVLVQEPRSPGASRRAHALLSQRSVRDRLRRGRGIYDAQRTLLDANHPLQGDLRASFARFLGEVREAFDEALSLAQYDQQAQRDEQSMYGESLVLWLEASPLRTEALAGRTTFTANDLAASARQETDLGAVLGTIVPNLNLVQPGMPARARAAIDGTRSRVTAPATGAPQLTTATGTTQTAADAAIATLNGAEHTIDRGRSLLRAALARLDVWLQAPALPVDVADRVDELFKTRDAGYGRLLRDRVQLMLTNLEGGGSLFAHMHRPGDTTTCATASTLGQMARPYDFEFCGSFRNLDQDAHILLHELAHAVIPGRGTRGTAAAGFPLDRAYAGERLLRRMTTEEALNNAESYWQLVAALSGVPVDSIAADTATGCADPAPLLDALAVAQSAHRRAWSYLHAARDALSAGRAIDADLRRQIDVHLGNPADADLLVMLADFGYLQSEGFVWYVGHTFACAPARDCPADAIAFDSRRVYKNGSVSARRRSGSRDPRICPAFFALGTDDRVRAAHTLVSLSFGDSLQRPGSVFGYAALALAIYRSDFGAPPASNLAEHQAADQPAAAGAHP